MKPTGAVTVDEQYYELYEGCQSKPIVIIEYLDDSGIWRLLDDVSEVSISTRIDDNRRGVYALLPPASTLLLPRW